MSNLTVISILTVVNSFLLVYFMITRIRWVIQSLELHDMPNARSSHGTSIPTMAGVAFFITLIMTLFFIQNFDTEHVGLNIIAAATLVSLVGLKDDLVVSTPTVKLTMETLAILFLLFGSGMQVPSLYGFLGIDTLPVVVAYIAIILMLLSIINAFNLIDGIDGLASVMAIIIFSIYALIFFATDMHFYFLICLSLIGMLFAYLIYNFSGTKKIFMGDTGSLFIGFCIGLFTLKFLTMDPNLLSHLSFKPENKLIVMAGVLCIPIFDLFRVIGVRLYNRKNLWHPDRNHVHHILIDTGLSHYKATMLLGLSNGILVIVIIWLSTLFNSYIMTLVLVVLFILFTGLFYIIKKHLPQEKLKE